MNFMFQKTPLVSTTDNALKSLAIYHITIWFMTIAALIIQAVLGPRFFVFGFMQVLVGVTFSAIIVIIKNLIKGEEYSHYQDYFKPITYGLLAALLLPVQSPIYMIIIVVILTNILEIVFQKLFQKNIMHPVLLSILVVTLIFRESLVIPETMINIFQSESFAVGRIRLFLGTYEGLTLGTSAFVILGLLWIYLSVGKIIDLKITLWYLIHLFLMVILYTIFTPQSFINLFNNVILGYTLFTLVFFIGEPTATPETRQLKAVFPFLVAVITVLLRLEYDIIEAALYATVFAQFLTWLIEQTQFRYSQRRLWIARGIVVVLWIALIVVTIR